MTLRPCPQSVAMRLLLAVSLALSLVVPTSAAKAQDVAVVQRLTAQGKMPREDARSLVRSIDQVLEANANSGEESYDAIRQATNRAMFGANAGAGGSRAEYMQRLDQVLTRMREGLNVEMLQVLFTRRQNASVMCAHRWGVSIGECDALLAAATLTPAALPYLPPDDGAALATQLRSDRVNRRAAREIVSKTRETMLGVPRILTRDSRGRTLIALLEACPGGSNDREAQIRAWHVGPTPGLVQCIAGALHSRGGAAAAAEAFGLSSRTAQAFVKWGEPAAPAAAPIASTQSPRPDPATTSRSAGRAPQVSRMTDVQAMRQQGASLMRARQHAAAAQAYLAAVQADATHAPTFAALGAAQLAAGNASGAVSALQKATELAPQSDAYFVGLGRALVAAERRDQAIAALQQAVRINYDNMDAREGLRALGGEVPDPPLPEQPSRDQIIAAMRPLQPGVEGCAPNFSGRVNFSVEIAGDTGNVTAARLEDSSNEVDEDGKLCMESVVQSARFPRFTRDSLTISYPFAIAATR